MVQEINNDIKVFNQFLLSTSEQENFKKMLGKYTSLNNLAMGIGLLKNNRMKAFDFTETIENAGRPSEKTIRTPSSIAIRNWKNLMNKYGWTWVNENVFIMGNDFVFPIDLIEKLRKDYKFNFQQRPLLDIIPENIRTSINSLFVN